MSVMMVVGSLPTLSGLSTTIYAAEPDVTQFATVKDLKDNFNLNGGTIGKLKFGLKGTAGREWLIAGMDKNNKDTLALLSSSNFGENSIYGRDIIYSSSIVRSLLTEYTTGAVFFSTGEQEYMADTTVTTADYDGTLIPVTDKLYLPDAEGGREGDKKPTIRVGTNNDISIDLKKLTSENGFAGKNFFWLRSAYDTYLDETLVAWPGITVSHCNVFDGNAVVPAFNLNLTSVLFASAVPATSFAGSVDIPSDSAMTLRYKPAEGTSLGSAIINSAQKSVAVSGAYVANTYLVVQNASGAWAQAVSGDAVVVADEVTIDGTTLTSFTDCKVWLETTNTDRITAAVMATAKTTPNAPTGLSDGVGKISGTNDTMEYASSPDADAAEWIPCTDTETVAAAGAWYVRYMETETAKASSATKVDVTAATYTIEATPELGLTFDAVNTGYTDIPAAKTVTITNTGNSEVTLKQPASTNYTMGSLLKATLAVGETTTFTVQPKKNLLEGIYNETLTVSTEQGARATVAVKFTVTLKPADAPKIINGAEGTWTKGDKEGLSFQSDAKFSEFLNVTVDGKELGAKNYTKKEGSIIVMLKPEYLETLAVGKHTLDILSKNGTADTTFTITAKAGETPSKPGTSTSTSSPSTGDSSNFMVMFALLLAASGTLTVLLAKRRRTGGHYLK